MTQVAESHSLRSYAAHLERRAVQEEGVPEELAHHAGAVTMRNLVALGTRELGAEDRRRVRAYFRGVVRRSSARAASPGAREYRARLIAAALAADLRECGADEARISREVSDWLEGHQPAAPAPLAACG